MLKLIHYANSSAAEVKQIMASPEN